MVVLFVHTCWVYCQDKLSLLLMSPNSHLDYSARSEVEFDKAQQVYDLCTLCDFICILFWVCTRFRAQFFLSIMMFSFFFFQIGSMHIQGTTTHLWLLHSLISSQGLPPKKRDIYHKQEAFVGVQNKHYWCATIYFQKNCISSAAFVRERSLALQYLKENSHMKGFEFNFLPWTIQEKIWMIS